MLLVLPFAYPKTTAIPAYLIGMILIGGALVIVGALDDVYQYKAKIQAVLLLTAGVLVQLFGDKSARVQIATLAHPLSNPHAFFTLAPATAVIGTAVYIFVVTKTMDTIDGIDGLAAGMAAISATHSLCHRNLWRSAEGCDRLSRHRWLGDRVSQTQLQSSQNLHGPPGEPTFLDLCSPA